MKTQLLVLAVIIPSLVQGKDLACSVKATRLDALTSAQAKIAEPEARTTALGQVSTAGATISSGGLEVEDGCLLYTYDVKVPGKRGVQEVVIDAGTGKVLRVEHESAAKEAAEKALDRKAARK